MTTTTVNSDNRNIRSSYHHPLTSSLSHTITPSHHHCLTQSLPHTTLAPSLTHTTPHNHFITPSHHHSCTNHNPLNPSQAYLASHPPPEETPQTNQSDEVVHESNDWGKDQPTFLPLSLPWKKCHACSRHVTCSLTATLGVRSLHVTRTFHTC